MDGQRFDRLTRALASGASRRSVLGALVGAALGGLATEAADARTIGTRPTIPPPPPPPPPTTTTTKAPPCAAGKELCPGGTLCCPTGTCARSGNSDICCVPDGGFPGRAPCGLDCCNDPLECCDGECCAPGSVCLTVVFGGETGDIEEETCCPITQTCDGRCCDGQCYIRLGSSATGFARSCCPAGDTVCNGDCCTGQEICTTGPLPVCALPTTTSTTTTTTTTPGPTTTTTTGPCPPGQFFCPGSGPGPDACCTEPCCGDVCCTDEGTLCCFGQTCQLGDCCNVSTCVELGYGDSGCLSCARDQDTGATSCVVAETGLSCGSGLFCCEGDCTSGPHCGGLVCCFGGDCAEGECCTAIDCVNLGYGDNQACVSCTNTHTCVVENTNGEVCGINPDAVCCSGFCTAGTTCSATTTTLEPPICLSLGDVCGDNLPFCCPGEGVCSPPDNGRCCIPDTQPCPPNPDDCCGACTPNGTCGD